jgi:decaprenylphospho-beta-D-erythro-pentofuranosid-2-ulose 2-reductase
MNNMKPSVLIIGASSGIGEALAREYAKHGFDLMLAARRLEPLLLIEKEIIEQCPVSVRSFRCDITETNAAMTLQKELPRLPDLIICSAGYLGDNELSLKEWTEAEKILHTNFTACIQCLQPFALQFKTRGSGSIIGISSVAGERGKSKNLLYSAAKAGFTAYLEGLRNELYFSGVHVMTVKPGYVRTPMTAHLALPKSMTIEANAMAVRIYQAYLKKKDIVYSSCKWRIIMAILRMMPEFLYKKKTWNS